MIPVVLLDELASFLRGANKDFRLQDEQMKENPLRVTPGYLKRREHAQESLLPHIVPRLLKGDDVATGSTATVRLYFVTYAEDVTDGWRDLFNLMEHSRQALLKKRTIAGRYRLQLPIHWEMVEEQPFPEYVGFMDVIYEVAQPREEIDI